MDIPIENRGSKGRIKSTLNFQEISIGKSLFC
jgi:hypothetical protein